MDEMSSTRWAPCCRLPRTRWHPLPRPEREQPPACGDERSTTETRPLRDPHECEANMKRSSRARYCEDVRARQCARPTRTYATVALLDQSVSHRHSPGQSPICRDRTESHDVAARRARRPSHTFRNAREDGLRRNHRPRSGSGPRPDRRGRERSQRLGRRPSEAILSLIMWGTQRPSKNSMISARGQRTLACRTRSAREGPPLARSAKRLNGRPDSRTGHPDVP
jgi:hypothetical protein